jgi:hypothetical protein
VCAPKGTTLKVMVQNKIPVRRNDSDNDNDNDKPIKSLLKGKDLLPPVGLARLDS